MSGREMRGAMLIGFSIAVPLCCLMVYLAFATGSTFGQRCAKAYPSDDRQQERCVERLVHGGRVYP